MTEEQNISGLLVILSGGEKGRTYSLNGPLTIGRSDENEVVIDDASVSRVHARIEPEGDKFVVTDLGSRNRIKMGKIKVRRCELSLNGEFTLGNVTMKVLPPTPEERPARQAVVTDPGGEVADDAPMDDFFEARGQQRERTRKIIFGIGSLLLATLAVYAVAPFFIGGPGATYLDVVVEEGREKAVAVWESRGRVPAKNRFRIDKPSVAEVTIDSSDGFVIKITGKAHGITKAEGKNQSGGKTIMQIVVRVRADEEWELMSLPDREKKSQALYLIEVAKDIQSHSPYQAMKKVGLAARVLEDVSPRPKEYRQAVSMEAALEKKIDTEFGNLKKDYILAAKAKNLEGAALRLRKIRELITDPNDYRHQRARLRLMRISRELRRRRRK